MLPLTTDIASKCEPLASFSSADIISIAALTISIILFPISFRISKKQSDNRKIKDALMDDLSKIRDDYRHMLNSLYSNKYDNKYILSWFKIVNIKLNSINKFSENKFKLKATDKIIAASDKMRIVLTDSDEFISTYKINSAEQHVILEQQTKTIIESHFAVINDEFLSSMDKINFSK
ncbi:MAG: hypothetical protein H6Q15_2213 [Bacteroidetes bacterium]|nr:hypothetical protein [Bacteroidota bacterium]